MVGKTYASDPVIQEMIRITVQRLSAKHHPNISKKKILNVLFQVKQQLPDENHIKDRLAYYWYKEGPYSETVDAGIKQLVLAGNIKIRSDYGTTYEFDSSKALMKHDDDMNEASRKISEIVERFVNIGDAVQDIYKAAPYEWYTAYNYTFRNKFEVYCSSILYNHASGLSNEDIQNALDEAVLKYPSLPEFIEHRRIFMDFAKMLNAFLLSDERANTDALAILQQVFDDIWTVFTHGVRIKHHDDYYGDRVVDWQKIYEQKLDDLDADIREKASSFEAVVADNRRFSPEIEDMILRPEKYDFKPLPASAIMGLLTERHLGP